MNSIHRINFNLIDVWNGRRKIQSVIQSIFDLASNRFSFIRPAALATGLHIYLGYDFNTEQIRMTLVNPANDTIINNSCIGVEEVKNGNKQNLPQLILDGPNNHNQISRNEAQARIENWKDDEIRNSWLAQRYTDYDSLNAIPQVFVVDKVDTQYGEEHFGYLALRHVKVSNTYEADLIIVNVETGSILSTPMIGEGSLEDIVYPCPPFSIRNPRDKFGLLERLNEQ